MNAPGLSRGPHWHSIPSKSGTCRAQALHFPGIYEIVRAERAISADVALRLGKYFGTTAQFWMNLQTDYDLRRAAASAPLSKIKPRSAA